MFDARPRRDAAEQWCAARADRVPAAPPTGICHGLDATGVGGIRHAGIRRGFETGAVTHRHGAAFVPGASPLGQRRPTADTLVDIAADNASPDGVALGAARVSPTETDPIEVDTAAISDAAKDAVRAVTSGECSPDRSPPSTGYGGGHFSFRRHADRRPRRYGISGAEAPVEAGPGNPVGGQEN